MREIIRFAAPFDAVLFKVGEVVTPLSLADAPWHRRALIWISCHMGPLRSRVVVSRVDADAGEVELSSERWSWLRWRWVRS